MSMLWSERSSTASATAGSKKLGQPVPELNLAPDLNSSLPQPAQWYEPSFLFRSNAPVNAISVWPWRSTLYCSRVSSCRHCSSGFWTSAGDSSRVRFFARNMDICLFSWHLYVVQQRSRPNRCPSDGPNDVLGVGVEGGAGVVVHEVDAEVVGADVPQFGQPVQLRFGRAEQAEAVHHLVGDEVGGRVAGLAVVGVVVALPGFDVVGQGAGDRLAGAAVTVHQVGDVVADHAAEPAG